MVGSNISVSILFQVNNSKSDLSISSFWSKNCARSDELRNVCNVQNSQSFVKHEWTHHKVHFGSYAGHKCTVTNAIKFKASLTCRAPSFHLPRPLPKYAETISEDFIDWLRRPLPTMPKDINLLGSGKSAVFRPYHTRMIMEYFMPSYKSNEWHWQQYIIRSIYQGNYTDASAKGTQIVFLAGLSSSPLPREISA